jgi:hypothetical protein
MNSRPSLNRRVDLHFSRLKHHCRVSNSIRDPTHQNVATTFGAAGR